MSGGQLGGKPLLGLDDDLHLVVAEEMVHRQAAIGIDDVEVEPLAGMEIPDLRHAVQPVKGGDVIGGKQVIYGGDAFLPLCIIAEDLSVVAAFGMGLQLEPGYVFLSVHLTSACP